VYLRNADAVKIAETLRGLLAGEARSSSSALTNAATAARLAGENIQVAEVRPGIMSTDMTAPARSKYDRLIAGGLVPQGRWGTPEDVGLAVRAFISGQLPFSTGSVIAVDGGLHIRRL